MPDAVQDPVVALGLKETVYDQAGECEREARQIELEQLLLGGIKLAFCVAKTHLERTDIGLVRLERSGLAGLTISRLTQVRTVTLSEMHRNTTKAM